MKTSIFDLHLFYIGSIPTLYPTPCLLHFTLYLLSILLRTLKSLDIYLTNRYHIRYVF